MSLREDLATARIGNQAKFRHISQGETSTLTLLQNKESDGTLTNFSPALTFLAGTYTKAAVKPDLDAVRDGEVIFAEELQLSEDSITAVNANLVQAAQVGTQQYLTRLTVGPRGLDRYWRFGIKPMETTVNSAVVSLPTGLLAFWLLDEASGNRLDSTANGNTLTSNSSVGQAAGKFGDAADFVSASSQSLTRAAGVGTLLTNAFTFAAWVYPTAAGFSVIASKGDLNSYNTAQFALEKTTQHRLALTVGGSNLLYVQFPGMQLSQWNLIIAWFDGAAQRAGAAINGQDATLTLSASMPAVLVADAHGLALGKWANVNGGYFTGRIDHAGLWNRALSEAEIAALWNGGDGLDYPFV